MRYRGKYFKKGILFIMILTLVIIIYGKDRGDKVKEKTIDKTKGYIEEKYEYNKYEVEMKRGDNLSKRAVVKKVVYEEKII